MSTGAACLVMLLCHFQSALRLLEWLLWARCSASKPIHQSPELGDYGALHLHLSAIDSTERRR